MSSPEISVSISNRAYSRFVVKEGMLRKGFLCKYIYIANQEIYYLHDIDMCIILHSA